MAPEWKTLAESELLLLAEPIEDLHTNVMLRVRGDAVEKIWSGDDILSNHYATSVHHDGFLYGFDGRQEEGERLRCVELKTGKVRWSQEGFGAGTVTVAGNHLLVMTERGELIDVDATPAASSKE